MGLILFLLRPQGLSLNPSCQMILSAIGSEISRVDRVVYSENELADFSFGYNYVQYLRLVLNFKYSIGLYA